MTLTLKQKLLIYILVIIFGLLVIGGLIVWPTVSHILSLQRDITILQLDMENRYEKMQKLRKSLQELDEIKTVVNQMDKLSIKQGEELSVITQLEQIALDHNIEQNTNLNFVDTSKEKIKPKDKPALPQYYKFSFLNNGYFAEHIHYLEDLERLPYYFIINNLSFEKRKNEIDTPNKITLKFDAIIYVRPN